MAFIHPLHKMVDLSTSEPKTDNTVYCKLISEEFVGSMVTLFLEDQNNHEFKVQMQERELSKFELKPGSKIWLSWSLKSTHLLEVN